MRILWILICLSTWIGLTYQSSIVGMSMASKGGSTVVSVASNPGATINVQDNKPVVAFHPPVLITHKKVPPIKKTKPTAAKKPKSSSSTSNQSSAKSPPAITKKPKPLSIVHSVVANKATTKVSVSKLPSPQPTKVSATKPKSPPKTNHVKKNHKKDHKKHSKKNHKKDQEMDSTISISTSMVSMKPPKHTFISDMVSLSSTFTFMNPTPSNSDVIVSISSTMSFF